jgi:hypothetical protein
VARQQFLERRLSISRSCVADRQCEFSRVHHVHILYARREEFVEGNSGRNTSASKPFHPSRPYFQRLCGPGAAAGSVLLGAFCVCVVVRDAIRLPLSYQNLSLEDSL